MDYSLMMPKCSSEGSGESLSSITALFRLWIMWRMRCVLPLKFHFFIVLMLLFYAGFLPGHGDLGPIIRWCGYRSLSCRSSDSDPRGGEVQMQVQEGLSSSGFACCSAQERKGHQSQWLIDVSAGRDCAFGRLQSYIHFSMGRILHKK